MCAVVCLPRNPKKQEVRAAHANRSVKQRGRGVSAVTMTSSKVSVESR